MPRATGPFFGSTRGAKPAAAKQFGESEFLKDQGLVVRTRRDGKGGRIKTITNTNGPNTIRRARVTAPTSVPREISSCRGISGGDQWYVIWDLYVGQEDSIPLVPGYSAYISEDEFTWSLNPHAFPPFVRIWGDSCGQLHVFIPPPEFYPVAKNAPAYPSVWAPSRGEIVYIGEAALAIWDSYPLVVSDFRAPYREAFPIETTPPTFTFYRDPRPTPNPLLTPTDTKNNIFWFPPKARPFNTGYWPDYFYNPEERTYKYAVVLGTGFPEFPVQLKMRVSSFEIGDPGDPDYCASQFLYETIWYYPSQTKKMGLNYGRAYAMAIESPVRAWLSNTPMRKADFVDQSAVKTELSDEDTIFREPNLYDLCPEYDTDPYYKIRQWRFDTTHSNEFFITPFFQSGLCPSYLTRAGATYSKANSTVYGFSAVRLENGNYDLWQHELDPLTGTGFKLSVGEGYKQEYRSAVRIAADLAIDPDQGIAIEVPVFLSYNPCA